MLKISEIIFQTCKTYLIQQGKFLLMLFAIIGAAMTYYFMGLQGEAVRHRPARPAASPSSAWRGSYAVAWYGIRVNTYANCPHRLRLAARQALGRGQHPAAGRHVDRPVPDLARTGHDGHHPALRAARRSSAICFLGFAIGESLGASALRIAGGIFTKIADIGSDLMKIVFKVKEDDPRNPGVIADCTGDNAGDSVGPTADGFETYGVTGVALISFITLADSPQDAANYEDLQAKLIVWIFAMRFLMDFMSGCSYFINQAISEGEVRGDEGLRLRAAVDPPDLDRRRSCASRPRSA